MNRFVVSSSVALATLAACAGPEMSSAPPGTPVPIVRLRSEPYSFSFVSGFDKQARVVVRDDATWQAVWTQIFRGGTVPAIPSVDFSQEMVVVAAQGSISTGGYGILIEGASESVSGLSITVRSVSPGRRCFVTAAFTQPVDIARVPRRDGAVKFTERSEVSECN